MKGDVKKYQTATQVTLLEVVLQRGGAVGMTNPVVVAVEQRKYTHLSSAIKLLQLFYIFITTCNFALYNNTSNRYFIWIFIPSLKALATLSKLFLLS